MRMRMIMRMMMTMLMMMMTTTMMIMIMTMIGENALQRSRLSSKRERRFSLTSLSDWYSSRICSRYRKIIVTLVISN
jgi:hypothetical protein